ncbi:acyltransferase family protein [Sporocytophaga myxococcoides]|uniref:acyltransferase family protein n=1 Tax=Sporocytophaga myxococcoides TaxID=153721 RepID=UPI00040F6D10|nr:acyltransferase [Sporocytophaga myxococcoides]
MSGKRLQEFDALRGIACMLVVLFHYAKYQYLDYGLGWKFRYGVTGVDLFFMISGFVIYMTLLKTQTIRDFIYLRVTRLFPTYWLAVTITFLFCIITVSYPERTSILNYLLNMTMVPSWLSAPFLDNSYWTLLVELIFYAIIAFFYFYFKTIKVLHKSITLLIILFVFNLVSIYTEHGQKIIFYFPIIMYWNLFLSGIVFYKMKFEGKSSFIYHLIIILNLAFLFLTHEQGGTAMHHVSRIEHLVCNIIFVILFYLLIYGKLAIITNKVMVFIGTISYSIYLLHQTIGYILIEKFYDIFKNSYISLILTLSIVFIISYLITNYFEKPFMQWSRNRSGEILKMEFLKRLRLYK